MKNFKQYIKRQIIKQVHNLHWGQFLVSKAQMLGTAYIIIKVSEFSRLTNIIILLVVGIVVLFSGSIWVKYFKEDFQNEHFKGAFDEKNNKNNT